MNDMDRFDGRYRRPRPHLSDEPADIRPTVDRRQLLTGGAMLLGMARMLPLSRSGSLLISALICLALSLAGFTPLIESGYPALGSLCATLLFPLCFPAPAASSS